MSARVLKFGGSSVADARRIRRVVDIVARTVAEQDDTGPIVVVVSALGGVTDLLGALADRAARNGQYGSDLVSLVARHTETIEALGLDVKVQAVVQGVLAELDHLLRGAELVRESSPRTRDGIFSTGERLSAEIVAGALKNIGIHAETVDARELIVTDGNYGLAAVDAEATEKLVCDRLGGRNGVFIVPGFIAATAEGDTTTLGRGGSDYSAALIGGALLADPIEIWTDVDGVMSADPSRVPDAFTLEELSFDELIELSHFGAKVVYAPTVHPARAKGVSLVIRNTRNPEFPGTLISEKGPPSTRTLPVRGVTSLSRVALLRLEGDAMVGRAKVAERLFRALATEGIRLLMVSQSSSGHTISFAIDLQNLGLAQRAVGWEFELEMRAGWIDPLVVQSDSCCMAVVGSSMQELTGVSGLLFATLGEAGINVRAIAQGSSELNISFVIASDQEERALRAVHAAFFKKRSQHARIYLAGTGRVGGAFLGQLASTSDLPGVPGENGKGRPMIQVGGISNSRKSLVVAEGVDLGNWAAALKQSEQPSFDLIEAALREPYATRVFVDCSSDPAIAARYPELLDNGVSVVAANKTGFAAASKEWEALGERVRSGGAVYFETTVGAGLPVLRTLADLVATGDRIRAISGVVSGTLSYVLSKLMEGRRLSEIVREAHQAGMTEPDPRADLSGLDVARKAVILARVAGFDVDPDQIPVEPLIPEIEGNIDEFWRRLPEHDDAMTERVKEALGAGKALVFLASVGPEGVSVGLEAVPEDHPGAQATGGDNVISIWTDRYADSPLSLSGPGAGPAVTAAGVYADVLRALAEV